MERHSVSDCVSISVSFGVFVAVQLRSQGGNFSVCNLLITRVPLISDLAACGPKQ
jgi:hypothetical protein